MNYMARAFQTEEELLSQIGINPEFSAITGVEFSPTERTITYTIRTLNAVDNVTVDVSHGEARRIKL